MNGVRLVGLALLLIALGQVAAAPHNIATVIFLVAITSGIGVGLATGGSIDQLLSVQFRGVWFLLFLLFVSVDLWIASFLVDSRSLLYWLYILQLMLVGVWVAYNAVHQPSRGLRIGLAIFGAGWLMNLAVILLNGGMPVPAHIDTHDPVASQDELAHVESYRTVALDGDTVLPGLGDIHTIPLTPQLVSLGDAFLTLGLATFAGFATHLPERVNRDEAATDTSHAVGESDPT